MTRWPNLTVGTVIDIQNDQYYYDRSLSPYSVALDCGPYMDTHPASAIHSRPAADSPGQHADIWQRFIDIWKHRPTLSAKTQGGAL